MISWQNLILALLLFFNMLNNFLHERRYFLQVCAREKQIALILSILCEYTIAHYLQIWRGNFPFSKPPGTPVTI